MSPARAGLPEHLRRYVVEQDYSRYTSEDQALWRFIMRQLKEFLSRHAHPCYVDGLDKTGIDINRIPDISVMDDKLAEFGWGAVPVSGFIPPAAFMEFQSLGILPIASDMRSAEHLTYTPAPDIVHEAAGHAPILINNDFAAYLKKYADVARNAIITKQDMDQYAAIRELSDVKENPDSSPKDIERAESYLAAVNRNLKTVSEAGWLSRMNWWTAEYGLIGDLKNPKIFGAGLLSSLGESRSCLSDKVKKIPLTIDCIETGYDITEPQPQLFVTPDFETLGNVLEQLAERMAFRIGGAVGLERARQAATVNSVELDSGLQISGVVEGFHGDQGRIDFVKFSGPSSLSYNRRQLDGHDPEYHGHGFSSPLGPLAGVSAPLWQANDGELARLGLTIGAKASLEFTSGITLHGELVKVLRHDGRVIVLSFKNCTVKQGARVLFEPAWGAFDLAVGDKVTKVFGGAADRECFGETDDFVAKKIPRRVFTGYQNSLFKFYRDVRELREQGAANLKVRWEPLAQKFFAENPRQWLLGLELLEIAYRRNIDSSAVLKLREHLQSLHNISPTTKECITDGIRLADIDL